MEVLFVLGVLGTVKRRLLDLGMIRGTSITPILTAPFGEPTAFSVRGSTIALRKEETDCIWVEY